MTAETCPDCGRPLDQHDQHIRFRLPDPVLELPKRERSFGTWMNNDSAKWSDFMYVPRAGAFVRALLPIKLTEGHSLTYGVWLGVKISRLWRITRTWSAPSYADLRVSGRLGNAIPPWGMLGAPVDAVVRNVEHTPYCDQSSDPLLQSVLHDEWPHDLVLGAV